MAGSKSSSPFAGPPDGNTLKLEPFQSHVPKADLDKLLRRLEDAEEIPTTFENTSATTDLKLGITKEWMGEMINHWKGSYDWRATEEEFNSFPHYITPLSTASHDLSVHFMALFSERKDAIPVVMTHGWPGSFLEFIPLFKLLTSRYTPATLPIHLICPSLIGFGFSSPPPASSRFSNFDVSNLWDRLMTGLGFPEYVAQGGDIGSIISCLLGQNHDACKAVHTNLMDFPVPDIKEKSSLNRFDRACVDRLEDFRWEFGYMIQHATKPATTGIAIASSPVALLAWIGEKYLRWSDVTPTQTQILDDVSLYYFTKSFATTLNSYWGMDPSRHIVKEAQVDLKQLKATGKPIGYSCFQKEVKPTLPEWSKGLLDLIWSAKHENGGHFAALEQPEQLWEDVQEFLKVAWMK